MGDFLLVHSYEGCLGNSPDVVLILCTIYLIVHNILASWIIREFSSPNFMTFIPRIYQYNKSRGIT